MVDYRPNYSLTTPPFSIAPLNPLVAADAKLLAPVQGVANLDEVREKLRTIAPNGRTLFALVTGSENCGLTSAAHCLVERYAVQRAIDPGHVIDIDHHPTDLDAASFWLSWISKLVDEIDVRRWTVTKELIAKIETALATPLPSDKPGAASQLGIRFRTPLRKLSTELATSNPPKGFVVRIEGILSPDFLTIAFDLFSTCSTICAFVVGEYADGRDKVIVRFNELVGDKVVVRMAPLSGAEAETVVRARWENANPPVSVPFEARAIEQAFKERPRPVKRVLVLMNQALEHKATVAFPGKIWPHDPELKFNGDELNTLIRFIEDTVLKSR
jgi:hypothetical protein